MLDKKNVIFIPPLAQELQELHKDYTEGEDKERYEVLDVSSLAEANQLIPSLGPALILTSAAKTCALMLKANKKFLKQFHSKVILVTPQNIPEQTINKLMKVGLNDFVQCPVNKKSLHYKCNLLLKSIKGTQIEEEVEAPQEDTLLSSEFGNMNIDTSSKQRIEKGIIEEHEKGELHHNDIEDVNLNIISSTMDNKKTRGAYDLKLDFAEDTTTASTTAKSNIDEDSNDDLEIQHENIELNIDNASQISTPENDLTIDPVNKQSTPQQTSSEEALAEQLMPTPDSLALTDENSATEQQDISLEITPDKSKTHSSAKTESPAAQTTATQKTELNIDQDPSSKATAHDISPKDDLEKIKTELAEELAATEEPPSPEVDLQIEDHKNYNTSSQANKFIAKKNKRTILGDKKSPQEKNTITKMDEAAEESKDDDTTSLEIQSTKKDKELTERKRSKSPTKKKQQEEITIDYHRSKHSKNEKNDDKPNTENKKIKLDIGATAEKQTKKGTEHEPKKKTTNPQLDLEEKTLNIHKKDQSNKDKAPTAKVDLKLNKKKQNSTAADLDIMRGEGKVEHLDRKMKSRKHHGELKIDFEKKNRGEGDTLDYSKIKKEYKELVHALNTLSPEDLNTIKKKKEEQLFTQEKIFEPHSKGVEFLITIFEQYEMANKTNDDIIFAMANILIEQFSAMLAIFLFNTQESTYKERFNNFEEQLIKKNGGKPLSKHEKWETIKLVNLEKWQNINQIQWQDETFKSSEQEFIFPYFQDNTKHGFTVISFPQALAKNKAGLVETIVESIRGIIIEEYEIENNGGIKAVAAPTANERTQSNSPISVSTSAKKTNEKKKGLFSRLFG